MPPPPVKSTTKNGMAMTAYRKVNRGPAVTFIVGLAGSGKSSLLAQMVYDVVFEENFWLSDEDHRRNHIDLIWFLKKQFHCVVVERRFMVEQRRAEYEQRLKEEVPEIQVNWLFFENDNSSAEYNCRSRQSKPGDAVGDAHIEQNQRDTLIYEVPPNGVTIKIHKWDLLSPYHAGECLQSIPGASPK